MELCLMIEGQEDVTWEDWLALADACELSGVRTLFRSDHYLSVMGMHGRGSLDAWATIAALSAVTTKLRFGTLVSPATFRHPSELAKVVTTADHISEGRVELGLGTGWLEAEHRAYGFPFPPLRERLEILEDELEIVSKQWADEPFSFDGRHYGLEDLDALPKPVQRPRPKLILGGQGGSASIALGARFADEYNTYNKTAEECAVIRRELDEACRRAHREPIPLSLMSGWLVGEDRSELLDRAGRLAHWRGERTSPEEFLANLPATTISGTFDEAVEKLRALSAVGVHRFMAQQLLHRDLDAVAQLGRQLAPAVA
jgi:alkanesulfonate monooxygenase SsuD/methylene tetrahydromethanopterin reductase-like flavin-dependent oxidoreductase (luciferase family)